MSGDAFRRLALVAACTVYVVGLAAVAVYLGWVAAVAAAVVGPLLAFVLALEPQVAPAARDEAVGVAEHAAEKGQLVTVRLGADAEETFRRIGG